jgi:hypothetical protein
LLSPHQEATPGSPVEWEQVQVKSGGTDKSLAVLAGERALADEKVIQSLSPLMLRQQIESISAFRDGWTHIKFGDLQNWYADYLYLYRLKDPVVLADSVRAGIDQMFDTQAYFFVADGFDEASGRYLGLKAGHKEALLVQLMKDSLIVQTDVAVAQRQRDEEAERERERGGDERTGGGSGEGDEPDLPPIQPPIYPPVVEAVLPRRYFGSVEINPQTIGSSVAEISQHVLTHLQSVYGSKVRISVEIEATHPDGFSDEVQEKVKKGSDALKFEQSDFSEYR